MAPRAAVAIKTDVNAERECPTTLSDTAEELLKFRLYQDDEGIWVCCDYCHKWRYVAEERDPAVFVERDFHCKDVNKKCNVGVEGESDHVFYETKVCAGSLVWAKRPDSRKAKDWPWWPALVEDSPDSASQYFLLDENNNDPIAYHVTYLDAYRTSGWVASNLVKPFEPKKAESNGRPPSRAGKKQRIIGQAIERAKNAATLSVVDRLDMFSYIAHLARLKGLILPCKQPMDKILNGVEPAPEILSEESGKTEASPANTAKTTGAKGRPRKRKLQTSGREVQRKKPTPSKTQEVPPATNGAETNEASPEEEPVEEEYLEISTEVSPRADVDSGYAIDDESPIDPAIEIGANKNPPKKRRNVRGHESDSFDLSGSSSTSHEIEGSQPPPRKADKAKKRVPAKPASEKVVPPKASESVKPPRKRKSKDGEQEPQSQASEQIETPKSRTSRGKKTQSEGSAPQNIVGEDAPQPKITVMDGSLGDGESESPSFVQDSGVESSSPLGPKPDQKSSRNDEGSDSANTLESTENLKVVRRRRSKTEDAPIAENNSPKTANFTQPMRKDKPTTTAALGERRIPDATTRLSNTTSMSQPLPSRSRRRFAPPTKLNVGGGEYLFEDLKRDMNEGVI